jgi:hypothetical protein
MARAVHLRHRELRTAHLERGKAEEMLIFALGMMLGTALGIIVVGFLAVRSYDHGYTEALERRQAWRGQLAARQTAAVRAHGSSLKRAS